MEVKELAYYVLYLLGQSPATKKSTIVIRYFVLVIKKYAPTLKLGTDTVRFEMIYHGVALIYARTRRPADPV